MLDASETAELRALHTQAYSRDGQLSASDSARLRELERKRRGEPVSIPDELPSARAADIHGSLSERSERRTEQAERVEVTKRVERPQGVETEPVPEAPPAPTPVPRKRRWPIFAAAAAAILLIGLGTGWTLWGWNSAESALAAAHAEQRAELESSGDYDPGSVVPVSEQHGVVVWQAERSDGEQHCVIITIGSKAESGCGVLDDPTTGAPGTAVTVPDGDKLAGQRFSAFLILSASGEIVPTVQIWDETNVEWEHQYTDAQLEAIAKIEAEGFDSSALSILGYDGDTAVWSSWDSQGLCVIAETDGGIVQGCSGTDEPNATLEIQAIVAGVPTNYIVHLAEQSGPQLTVVKLPLSAQVEVDPETGDVIEFTVDEPSFDDLAIDDKTGE
ncbi:MAG: hypothetical protein ACTH8F_03045 [Microbacterium sp.]|uniref:hypothetical protein n=1 Tax=Microbacterium sp. TaxID=51671 RepID=UPI003F9C84BE